MNEEIRNWIYSKYPKDRIVESFFGKGALYLREDSGYYSYLATVRDINGSKVWAYWFGRKSYSEKEFLKIIKLIAFV